MCNSMHICYCLHTYTLHIDSRYTVYEEIGPELNPQYPFNAISDNFPIFKI